MAEDTFVLPEEGPGKKSAIRLEGFSPAEVTMIEQAVRALKGAGYDTGIIKELVRVDLPAGKRAMTWFATDGALLGPEAFTSQAMLNHVLEEELLHLIQTPEARIQEFGPDTAQALEDAVHAARKFHQPP